MLAGAIDVRSMKDKKIFWRLASVRSACGVLKGVEYSGKCFMKSCKCKGSMKVKTYKLGQGPAWYCIVGRLEVFNKC